MRRVASRVSLVVAMSLFAAVGQGQDARIGSEAAAYLAEALGVMRTHYYDRDAIDWPALTRRAFDAAAGAELPIDTWEALRGALSELSHSFLQLDGEEVEAERRRRRERGLPPLSEAETDGSTSSPFASRRQAEAHFHAATGGDIARLVIPAFGGSPSRSTAFAQQLQDFVGDLAARQPCGWAVDLRGNGGGNMWPMLVGVGPVLGEGIVGAFELDRRRAGNWFYRDGVAGTEGPDGFIGARIAGEALRLDRLPPVAVLIDAGTGSSGEATAIAFKGRPQTRFFGTATAGLSTSTDGFRLSDDVNVVIAVGLDVDRTGHAYPAAVDPDVRVPSPAGPDDGDAQLEAALGWLRAEFCE